MTLEQKDVRIRGHAVECRINAEDPKRDFLPAVGEVEFFLPPCGPSVRVDTHLYSAYTPPGAYDSLIAKIIPWSDNRDEAVDRMRRTLRESMLVGGLKTTIPFQLAFIDDPAFRSGRITINYVAEFLQQWKEREALVGK